MNDLYLAHHGIKGMKWGVRRFQKKDGSLTPAGKKRYSEKTQAKYDRYYEKYKAIGYDDEKAAKAARGRIGAERTIKIAGGLAVVGAAAYAGYRYYDNNVDRFVPAGQTMQTVHQGDAYKRMKPGNPFYATFDKKDNTIYASRVFSHFGEQSKVTSFFTEDGIKVASEGTGRKIFNDLASKNPEVAEYAKRVGAAKGGKKDYLKFNYSLVLRNNSDTAKKMGLGDLDHDKVHNLFYDELKKKGYGAIIDSNDAKREGFSFKPMIVFDSQRKHVVGTAKATKEQLGDERLLKGMKYAMQRRSTLRPNENPLLISSGLAYAEYVGVQTKNNKTLDRKVKFVEQYRDEHPNTKKTNAEIAEMYVD